MSQDYDVHMSLRLKPMALRVEGTRGAVREVTEHILAMRQVRHTSCCLCFCSYDCAFRRLWKKYSSFLSLRQSLKTWYNGSLV